MVQGLPGTAAKPLGKPCPSCAAVFHAGGSEQSSPFMKS